MPGDGHRKVDYYRKEGLRSEDSCSAHIDVHNNGIGKTGPISAFTIKYTNNTL